MAKINLGSVICEDKGTWTNDFTYTSEADGTVKTGYKKNHVVHTDNGIYRSLVDNNTTNPDSDTAHTSWHVVLDKSDINTAISNANTAASNANTATESANTAASNTTKAIENANTAISNAGTTAQKEIYKLATTSETSPELASNTYTRIANTTGLTANTTLDITLATPTDGVQNVYEGSFDTDANAETEGTKLTVNFPDTVKWDSDFTVTASTHYEFSIRYDGSNYYGLHHSWSLA